MRLVDIISRKFLAVHMNNASIIFFFVLHFYDHYYATVKHIFMNVKIGIYNIPNVYYSSYTHIAALHGFKFFFSTCHHTVAYIVAEQIAYIRRLLNT